WGKIEAKIEKLIGPRAMAIIRKVIEYVSALLSGGVAGLWEKIKEDLSGLKDMVIGAIQDWAVTAIVKVAIQKLLTLTNPAGAIAEAVMGIYKTVMFFIEKAGQLGSLVETIVSSVHSIATGAIGQAANWVEQAMGRSIPIVIGFLADLIGLGGLSDTIQKFVK